MLSVVRAHQMEPLIAVAILYGRVLRQLVDMPKLVGPHERR